MRKLHAVGSELCVRLDAAVVAALTPEADLDRMTFDAILAVYADLVVGTAGLFGVRLTDADVEAVLERLVAAKEMPPFPYQHNDVLSRPWWVGKVGELPTSRSVCRSVSGRAVVLGWKNSH